MTRSVPSRPWHLETATAALLGMSLGLAMTAFATPTPQPYVLQLDLSGDVAQLGSDDPFESDAAVDHLVALGPITVPILAVALQREGPEVRARVVEVVRQFDDPAALALLIQAAGDPDLTVRADALLALGLSGKAPARDVVEAALRDPNQGVRRAALIACARVCASPETLRQLVDAALTGPDSIAVRQSLAEAIADADAARAKRVRDAIARDAVPALASTDPSRRFNAALTAALIGEPTSVPILAPALRQGPPDLAVQAAFALATVPTPDAVAALAGVARTASPRMVGVACISLHNLKILSAPGAAAASAPCPGAANAAAAVPPTARSDP